MIHVEFNLRKKGKEVGVTDEYYHNFKFISRELIERSFLGLFWDSILQPFSCIFYLKNVSFNEILSLHERNVITGRRSRSFCSITPRQRVRIFVAENPNFKNGQS